MADKRPINSGIKWCWAQKVAVISAMKMEHTVEATDSGVVKRIVRRAGEQVMAADALLFIETDDNLGEAERAAEDTTGDSWLPELDELRQRQAHKRTSSYH